MSVYKENHLHKYILDLDRIDDIDAWNYYKQQVASFWQPGELDLTRDANDWEQLTQDEKHFIGYILAYFASADGMVSENLAHSFLKNAKTKAAEFFYGFQIAMENIHAETYSLLLKTIIKDEPLRWFYIDGILKIASITAKANWALKWTNQDELYAQRILGFCIVEGLFFSASFSAIFWLKKRNKLPGLCTSNEFISRDEGLHTTFAIHQYNKGNVKVEPHIWKSMLKEAVSIEKSFIIDAIPCAVIGMNSVHMGQYIEYVADHLSSRLGFGKIYNSENPFPWMESISLERKTNFFEHRPTEYQLVGAMSQQVKKTVTFQDSAFNTSMEF